MQKLMTIHRSRAGHLGTVLLTGSRWGHDKTAGSRQQKVTPETIIVIVTLWLVRDSVVWNVFFKKIWKIKMNFHLMTLKNFRNPIIHKWRSNRYNRIFRVARWHWKKFGSWTGGASNTREPNMYSNKQTLFAHEKRWHPKLENSWKQLLKAWVKVSNILASKMWLSVPYTNSIPQKLPQVWTRHSTIKSKFYSRRNLLCVRLQPQPE
mgnify:CR=1 FL=1